MLTYLLKMPFPIGYKVITAFNENRAEFCELTLCLCFAVTRIIIGIQVLFAGIDLPK